MSSQEKQKYLYDEIIQNGYCPNSFIKYMGIQKENGENIENWSMSELIQYVNIFKNNYE